MIEYNIWVLIPFFLTTCFIIVIAGFCGESKEDMLCFFKDIKKDKIRAFIILSNVFILSPIALVLWVTDIRFNYSKVISFLLKLALWGLLIAAGFLLGSWW